MKGLMSEQPHKRRVNLEKRIEERYESLPSAERRLADLLLRFPGDVANYTASELAGMAGTSKAAATRLFRRLGYGSFNEAREEIRDAGRWGSPIYLAGEVESASHRDSLIHSQMQHDHENLARTLEMLDEKVLAEIVEALASARQVIVVGFRNSYFLAAYMQRQLVLLRENVKLLPATGQTLGEDLAELGPEDILVAVGLRRRITGVAKAMEAAQRAGAKCLLVTDPSAIRTTKLATWTIVCQVRGISVFDSYAAATSVLNLLCTAMFQNGGKHSYVRLRRIEEAHEELDELDSSARHSEHG